MNTDNGVEKRQQKISYYEMLGTVHKNKALFFTLPDICPICAKAADKTINTFAIPHSIFLMLVLIYRSYVAKTYELLGVPSFFERWGILYCDKHSRQLKILDYLFLPAPIIAFIALCAIIFSLPPEENWFAIPLGVIAFILPGLLSGYYRYQKSGIWIFMWKRGRQIKVKTNKEIWLKKFTELNSNVASFEKIKKI